jgi:hypothetical protein
MNRIPSHVALSLILALFYSGVISALVDLNAPARTSGPADIEPLSIGESIQGLPADRSASILRLRLTLPYMPPGRVRRESQEI